MTGIPVLTTERLVLRPMTADDWPEYWSLMGSDRARHMGGPHAEPVAWGMFCADHAMWDLFGCGALMIEHREDSRTLGQVAVNSGPLFPEHELGWFLYPHAEGAGYAFEAASEMRRWARDVAGCETLVSYVDADNSRSRRLAERLGAKLDSTAKRPHPDDLVYRHYTR